VNNQQIGGNVESTKSVQGEAMVPEKPVRAVRIDITELLRQSGRYDRVEKFEIVLPVETQWLCPSCGEHAYPNGAYATAFVVETNGEGLPLQVLLKGTCGRCGEDKMPPAIKLL
jgi:hypothetical protein